jgi:hypothetical protein
MRSDRAWRCSRKRGLRLIDDKILPLSSYVVNPDHYRFGLLAYRPSERSIELMGTEVLSLSLSLSLFRSAELILLGS